MTYVGIDPGESGGIVVLDETGQVLTVAKMPETEPDILSVLPSGLEGGVKACIEKVHASPGAGVSGMFKFGMSYGGLRMALAARMIPFEAVSPGVWQRKMGCLTGGDKKVTTRKAAELFPSERFTLATTEAALIAEYCRRKWLGVL